MSLLRRALSGCATWPRGGGGVGVRSSWERQQEHLANFALGGMAVGLLGAGILTRNIDKPKIPVAPTLGATTDAAGTSTTTFGVGGAW